MKINQQVMDIIKSFETKSKKKDERYKNLLIHIHITFDKKISSCKNKTEMNKYKKIKNSVLSYIVANEKEIIAEISK